MSKKIFTIFIFCVIFSDVVLVVNINKKGEKSMIKINNQEVILKILSCIFAVIVVVYMILNRNIIDLFYLGGVSILIFKYFIENNKK